MSEYEKEILEARKNPNTIEKEFERQKKIVELAGLNTPAGQEAEARANELKRQYEKAHEGDQYRALMSFLLGMGQGAGGGARESLKTQAQQEAARFAEMKDINALLSPIEEKRRADKAALASGVTSTLAKEAEQRASENRELGKTAMTGRQNLEQENLRQINENFRNQISNDRALQIARMQTNATLAGKEITAEEIAKVLQKDKAFEGKSYGEIMTAAFAIKQGAKPELGRAGLVEKYAKDWNTMGIIAKDELKNQGITSLDQYVEHMIALTSGEKRSDQAMPLPASQADLKNGVTYQTKNGPAKWDASKGKFVQ
jgi:hypothetical protein